MTWGGSRLQGSVRHAVVSNTFLVKGGFRPGRTGETVWSAADAKSGVFRIFLQGGWRRFASVMGPFLPMIAEEPPRSRSGSRFS